MKQLYIILITSLIAISNYAQNYQWKASINEVDVSGYYKIYLDPDIISQLEHSFPDIRILDKNNNETQYILKKQKTVLNKNKKIELKITKNKHRKFKHYTEIQIENEKKYSISNLILRIVNTHNPVFVKIFGSDNLDNWYILKDNFPAVPDITDSDSTEIKIMDIPESKFKFFKVYFYDYEEKPIEITNVYYHNLEDIRAEYIQLKSPIISQKDTLNKTIITLEFEKPEFIDMITFRISGPEYYLRKVQMLKKDTISNTHMKNEFYDQLKKEFYLGSLKSNRINLYDYKAKKIEFIVENKDNQPLIFLKANAYQLKNYIVAYLNQDNKYTLIYGNEKANFPSYDLPYFKDTIPKILPETSVYNIKKINGATDKINKIWTFPTSYLWYIIGFLLIVLLLISFKLLKERFGETKKTE